MKHLLNVNTDTEATFRDYDMLYYVQDSDKSYIKKYYENPFIKIFMKFILLLIHNHFLIPISMTASIRSFLILSSIVIKIQIVFMIMFTKQPRMKRCNSYIVISDFYSKIIM